MHCHTAEHSHCSHVSAADLVQSNFDKGLQGTVLTDHQFLWTPEEIKELRSRIKVPAYYLILSGQEVDTPELGHVLVYGAGTSLGAGTTLAFIRNRYPEAAIVWAHPYRNENIPSREMLFHSLIHGVEIFSTNHTVAENNRGLHDWHRYKFTALSGTDAHGVSYAGLYPTIFDHPFSSVEELAQEIRAGRCRPYFHEIPRSGTSQTKVIEVTIGTQGEKSNEDKYVIRTHDDAETWRASLRTARMIDELRRHGFAQGRYRVPRQYGQDEESRTVIEQGLAGKILFDALSESGRDDARLYLRMAAGWLARLHNAQIQLTPPDEFMQREPNSLEFYMTAFYNVRHPETRRADEIMNTVLETEAALYCSRPERMVQGHGDYHPKNIFIGRDRKEDIATAFVAAIDFNSSCLLPPAFDVGTFLAQFRNQFYDNREVLSKVSEEMFLEFYLEQAGERDKDFLSQVELFKARTALSICHHLIMVGLGRSENLWRVLVEAGRVLTHLQVTGMRTQVIAPPHVQRKSA